MNRVPTATSDDGKAVSKGPEAFRTISEVAGALDLPQHVLRFWETRFKQIKPMKRGGGRRYYRPQDVELLRGIRYLLYGEGYTIRGVQRILKDDGIQRVAEAGRGASGPLPARKTARTEPSEADQQSKSPPKAAPQRARKPVAPPAENPVAAASNGGVESLEQEEVGKLQETLAELVELKRLLDQAR